MKFIDSHDSKRQIPDRMSFAIILKITNEKQIAAFKKFYPISRGKIKLFGFKMDFYINPNTVVLTRYVNDLNCMEELRRVISLHTTVTQAEMDEYPSVNNTTNLIPLYVRKRIGEENIQKIFFMRTVGEVWANLSKRGVETKTKLDKYLGKKGLGITNEFIDYSVTSADITIDKPWYSGIDFLTENKFALHFSKMAKSADQKYFVSPAETSFIAHPAPIVTSCKRTFYDVSVPALQLYLQDNSSIYFYIKERPYFRQTHQRYVADLLRIERRFAYSRKLLKENRYSSLEERMRHFTSYDGLRDYFEYIFKKNHTDLIENLNLDYALSGRMVRRIAPLLLEVYFPKYTASVVDRLLYGSGYLSTAFLNGLGIYKNALKAKQKGLLRKVDNSRYGYCLNFKFIERICSAENIAYQSQRKKIDVILPPKLKILLENYDADGIRLKKADQIAEFDHTVL
ncbi:hypothetical protein [Bdellovibrio sp.]|uniref:hypothetical protein n=1 Tax=Bdellovibrio sp. TaxID=28201 RepID=UPI003221C101